MKKSKKIALTGMLSALSIVLMFLGSVITVLAYIMPLVSGLLMVILGDFGKKNCWSMFTVVSLISLFALPDKECALTYIFFFGYYPIIKEYIDKIKNKFMCWIARFVVFNVGIVASQLICFYVFGIPFDDVFGKWGIAILLALGNVVLVVYVRLLNILVILYDKKYRKIVNKLLK